MSDDRRIRRRRRLLLLGLLPLLLALAFAGKVATMLDLDRDGRAAYGQGQYADARGSFAANTTLNVLETWVAHYDEGTARYRGEDFGGAVDALRAALLDVPPAEECRVRINLALSYEAIGDAALVSGQPTRARTAWQAGVTALAQGSCLASGDGTARGAASAGQRDDSRAVDGRLRDKLAQARNSEQTAEDAAAAEQQGRLDRRNEVGEEQRGQTEQRQEDQQDQEDQQGQEGQGPTDDPAGQPPPVYEW